MNCVSWNCQGLGNRRRVRELSDILKDKGPNLVFLMETRAKASYLEKLRCRLKFDNVVVVPRKNRGGWARIAVDEQFKSTHPNLLASPH